MNIHLYKIESHVYNNNKYSRREIVHIDENQTQCYQKHYPCRNNILK